MNIALKDFYRLKPLAKKCRTRIRVKEKYGLPFFLNRHRKRKVFVLGICCCGFFIYLLAGHIWNIRISGNLEVSRPVFMEYLKECGINYGTAKTSIDCKEMAAKIRNEFSDFTWVSVKIKGTGLIIDVQENTDIRLYEERDYDDSDLISDVTGEIVGMITRDGVPQVKVGDQIEEGQILVLGRLEITDDSDTVVNYQYCAADADVYVKTTEEYREEFSLIYQKNSYTGRKRYGGFLNIGGTCFGVAPFIRSFEQFDLLQKERQVCVRQDFYLPLSVSWCVAREYVTETCKYTENEAKMLAEEKLHKFLTEKEQKGVQIFEKNVKIDISATSCLSSGTITFIEKAGKRVGTEYLELQQENDAS